MRYFSTRRNLGTLSAAQCEHAGLWLDRCMSYHGRLDSNETPPKDTHLEDCINRVVASDYYSSCFWPSWNKSIVPATHTFALLKTSSKLLVGIGADSVLETSLRIHRTYGVPVIPGTSIKGAVAHYCRVALGRNQDGGPSWADDLEENDRRRAFLPSSKDFQGQPTLYDELFGKQGLSGCVAFHDAFPAPPTTPGSVPMSNWLGRDVMTPHHSSYYTAADGTPPADYDDPIPVPYLVVRAGVSFLFVVEGEKAYREAAMKMLQAALSTPGYGIGAKKTLSFGQFSRTPDAELASLAPLLVGEVDWAEWLKRPAHKDRNGGPNWPTIMQDLQAMPSALKCKGASFLLTLKPVQAWPDRTTEYQKWHAILAAMAQASE